MNRRANLRVGIDVLSDVPGRSGQVRIFKNLLAMMPVRCPDWTFHVLGTPALQRFYTQAIGQAPGNLHWIDCWWDNNDGSIRRTLSQELLVPRLLDRHSIDVLLCYPLPFVTPLQRTRTIYRHTCPVSTVGERRSLLERYRLRKLLFSVGQSDATIFNSHAERLQVERRGVSARSYRIIWESIDHEHFRPDATFDESRFSEPVRRLGAETQQLVLVPTGFQPRKNSRLVLEYVKLAKERLRGRVVFAFMGGNEPSYAAKLNDEFADLIGEGLVVNLGFCTHQELAFIGRRAVLAVYPSLIETFGVPPLELMNLHKPVIISDIEPLVEISGPGAAVFRHDSVDDLGATIETLLGSPEKRSELAERGARHVRQFTWERNVDQTAQLIRQVMGMQSDGQ